ncbi:MAG: Eco29kI family restriction endonuclease [Myxococcales bacterium]|nr:Eco29kI family restriction endonuclease [Myxococcales bacterium]
MADVYNPLDYGNLTKNLVRELLERGPYALPPVPFQGPGVYALFYKGQFEPYSSVRSAKSKKPIYVGKAVPAGARKGAKGGDPFSSKTLHSRISQHSRSVELAENLALTDFSCRYLVVEPLWITMAERFLIEHYQPVWNVCLDGFGNHDPGKGRHQGEITWWDALHPGREWAKKLKQTRSAKQAKDKLAAFFAEEAH